MSYPRPAIVLLLALVPFALTKECEKQYGKDKTLCQEGSSDCTFLVTLRGDSCDDFCGQYGGTCLSSAANEGDTCREEGRNYCHVGLWDNLCTCSKGKEKVSKPQPPPSGCKKQYGDDILLCRETSDHCLFMKRLGGDSCSSFCKRNGGTCSYAESNVGDTCMSDGANSCNDPFTDNICKCSLDSRFIPPTLVAPTPANAAPRLPSPASSTCEATYANEKEILVCDEKDDRCTFFVVMDRASCRDYCARQGGTCLSAARNKDDLKTCETQETNSCDDVLYDNICTCSLETPPTPPPPSPVMESCAEKYGKDKDFLVCNEEAGESCTFFVVMDGKSCDEYCGDRGGICYSAKSNKDAIATCETWGANSCAAGFYDNICTCSLGSKEAALAPRNTPCSNQYSSANLICGEGTSQCTVVAQLDGKNCNDFCEERGGTCIEASESIDATCMSPRASSCGTSAQSLLCTCTLGDPPRPPPTPAPTPPPTAKPTLSPTLNPTPPPTAKPTLSPTLNPTPPPTAKPTSAPTRSPTPSPTPAPTPSPTPAPTPSPTPEPTPSPTPLPTAKPTPPPSPSPTRTPTATPTSSPTLPPTTSPTQIPTANPTKSPTESPSELPTTPPTPIPTSAPSLRPSVQQTPGPTQMAAESSTEFPTKQPTPTPTGAPTLRPSVKTTPAPTTSPTQTPTKSPTNRPTMFPTLAPSPKSSANSLGDESTLTPTSPPAICGKCFRNGCFEQVTKANQQKCKKFACATRVTCPQYRFLDASANKITKPPTTQPPAIAALTPPPTEEELSPPPRSTGEVCMSEDDCKSSICRNGVCMATAECYPIKHEFGTRFDKNRINLVFVGSAFDDYEDWKLRVTETYDFMKGYKMFSQENKELNVFRVDPPQLFSSFCANNCAGIERLLCCSIATTQKLSSKCMPDGANVQTLVIHNDSRYGGAGYTLENIATVSTHPRGPEVMVHELGHSLFELGDEYSYGPGTDLEPNCAATSDCSKWSDLIGRTPTGYNQVSCVPGCRNNRFYVGEKSYMSVLTNDVGAVNTRYTCCTYLALTKTFPSYCKPFDFEQDYLVNFCKGNDYQRYGDSNYNDQPKLSISTGKAFKDKSKYMYVSDPLLVDVSLNHKKGRAVAKNMPVSSSPGLYRKKRVIGDFKRISQAKAAGFDSVILVRVLYRQGTQRFYFSTNTTIEIPTHAFVSDDIKKERIAVSEQAEVLNLVLDTKGRSFKKVQAKFLSTYPKA